MWIKEVVTVKETEAPGARGEARVASYSLRIGSVRMMLKNVHLFLQPTIAYYQYTILNS